MSNSTGLAAALDERGIGDRVRCGDVFSDEKCDAALRVEVAVVIPIARRDGGFRCDGGTQTVTIGCPRGHVSRKYETRAEALAAMSRAVQRRSQDA